MVTANFLEMLDRVPPSHLSIGGNHMRREYLIRVRLSDAELRRLTANARAVGLSLSEFLRWRGLLLSNTPAPQRLSLVPNTTKITRSS